MKSFRGRGGHFSELFFRPGQNDHLSSSHMIKPCLEMVVSLSFRVTLVSCFTHE